MPNILNDKDINEIEINFPIDGQKIHYLDYYQPKYLSNGSLFPKDVNILNNLKPSYVIPETIKLLGHWNDAGFIIKFYVIKTELNSLSLLNLYLNHIPTDNPVSGATSNLSCMMYDFFAQVELRTGFGEASNKKYAVHLHRGFSRHCVKSGASVRFFGDYYGTLTTNNNTNFGIYEQSFNFGVNYTLKGVRTDNIYSEDKFEVIDENEIPAKKILDIYESLTGPITSTLTFTLRTSDGNYKEIKRITNDGLLPPNFTIEGERIYSDNLTNKLSYIYDKNTSILSRPDYTLNLYVKLLGEDGRVLDPADTSRRKGYQKFSYSTNYWSNKGELIQGSFKLTKNENIYIQNKSNVKIAPLNTLVNSSTAKVGSTAPVSDFFPIDLNYIINGQFSSGYLILSDKRDSENGAKLCHKKSLRLRSEVYFYDENYNTKKGEIRFRLFIPLTNNEKNSGIKYLTAQPNNPLIYDFYNLATHIFITQKSYKTDETLLTRTKSVDANTSNLRSFKSEDNSKLKVNLELFDNKERFNNREFNPFDFPQDGRVIFRGEALPCFIYNRKPEIDLSNKVLIKGNGQPPENTTDTVLLNTYRYLRYDLKLQSGDKSVPHRVTLWESTGTGVTSRYFDRTLTLDYNSKTSGYLDLIFPDYPGKRIDTQDDPYPRLSGDLSSEERFNSPYYGCNRIIRIDIDTKSDINPIDFSLKAVHRDIGLTPGINRLGFFLNYFDELRFNPPSNQDNNFKKLSTNSIDLGRRFLLLSHSDKPEEETDIVITDGKIKYLTTSEFVNRLNNLHFGLDCKVINEAPVTLTQGQHYRFDFPSKIKRQNNVIIRDFYPSINTVNPDNAGNNLIYYSQIFDGTYLDFPPFVQDFFNTDTEDTWTKSNKRRDSNSRYHLDLKAYVSLRGKVFGHIESPDALRDYVPRTSKILSNIKIYENDNFFYRRIIKSDKTGNNGNDLYRTDPIFPNYDINNNQFNFFEYIYRNQIFNSPIKVLSNKATRLTLGIEKPYKPNPFITPLAYNFNYFSAAESFIKNEVAIVMGRTTNTLNPYKANETKNITLDGQIRVVNYNSFTLDSYDLKTVKNNNVVADIYGYAPTLLNQNLLKNSGYFIFSETYKFKLNNQINPQSLVFYNYSIDDKNSWVYYNDNTYLISKIFEHTENNSYCFSPNLNDIYSLGVFSNSLILQSINFDLINKSSDLNINANEPLFSVLIDGENLTPTEKTLFPELIAVDAINIGGTINKWSSVVAPDNSNVVCFYSFDTEINSVYYKILNDLQLSVRQKLFSSGSLTFNGNFAISNFNIVYDSEQKLFRSTFLLSLNQSKIALFYTEFDYNDGEVSKPLLFHFISGSFLETDYITTNIFVEKIFNSPINSSVEIPYQKPAIVIYKNSDQKGLIGIFYVNNNGNLCVVNIKPFAFTSLQQELQ